MARVSVGLPVYNGENYVRESIESILAQTYQDFEFIIVDNASTDRTQQICQEYAARDKRIRYYRQKTNVGLAGNSNRVLELATGEYFKWISHDDLHGPEFIARCVEILDSDPSVILACSRGVLIDGKGAVINILQDGRRHYVIDEAGARRPFRRLDPPRKLDSHNPAQRFHDLVIHTEWCLEIYGLMRTDVVRKTRLHGGYIGTDKRLLAEMALLGRFAEFPDVQLFYRQHLVQEKRYQSTAAYKDVYVGGRTTWRSTVPRLNNLIGFWTTVSRSSIAFHHRLPYYLVVVKWLLQLKRWPAIIREGFDNLRWAFRFSLRNERVS